MRHISPPTFARTVPFAQQHKVLFPQLLDPAADTTPWGSVGGDKRPIPRGQPGEASPAESKRSKRGERNGDSHARGEGVERGTTAHTSAQRHSEG